ncbi:hypothetical protein [Gordonia sihwensis]|uniref:hypothetical protein n=1 Tax=Gordonia sihwensis TaxID=173559 RepID=UPI0005EF1800|nr:hypothetical protein [Gordonia sihwensis]KJR10273.1 hypothetical protein UG54_01455 [Gordonia sihwensis]
MVVWETTAVFAVMTALGGSIILACSSIPGLTSQDEHRVRRLAHLVWGLAGVIAAIGIVTAIIHLVSDTTAEHGGAGVAFADLVVGGIVIVTVIMMLGLHGVWADLASRLRKLRKPQQY